MQQNAQITGFRAKKVDLSALTPEQRIEAIDLANTTGQPLEEIVSDILSR